MIKNIFTNHTDVGVGSRRLTVVHISDTHTQHRSLKIQSGDILIHSGDFVNKKDSKERILETISDLNDWFGSLPHRHKVVIAGNHELPLSGKAPREIQRLLPNATYLQDSWTQIDGLTIYGTPWTRNLPLTNAFACPTNLADKWKLIPTGVHVLVTHMPPFDIFDNAWQKNGTYEHWGCSKLKTEVLSRIRPLCHLFGHVHDDTGVRTEDGITFSNAATALSQNPNVLRVHYDPPVSPLPATVAGDTTKFLAWEFSATDNTLTNIGCELVLTVVDNKPCLTKLQDPPSVSQRWHFDQTEGSIISCMDTTLALDANNMQKFPSDDPVLLWEWRNKRNQQWVLDPVTGTLTNKRTTTLLVPATFSGTEDQVALGMVDHHSSMLGCVLM
eukprot:TRINITY_DN64367_c0_g1_i3.p1 TRINITY_DN64367_c0_g1~~TRINITY_DN64367_c0_g1_i3.p1  ORF type:complete len:386 (-),score=28.25 TRINITY_DN64367_c0_g1_i3:1016-2173(-)